MPVFADQMKNFTDHLRISIENRTDALGQVHQATNHLLDCGPHVHGKRFP